MKASTSPHLFCLLGFVFTVFGFHPAIAQDAVPTAGGEAINDSGSVSYTLGQIVYTTESVTHASVAQGVQQPYEISVVTGAEEAGGIELRAVAYPNPTRGELTLRVSDTDYSRLSYELYDHTGRLLLSQRLTANEVSVPMTNTASGVYLLKVMSPNKDLKTFRIVRN